MSLESKSAWIYQALYNPAKIITVQSNSLKSQSHYNPTIPSYLGDFGMKKDGFAWARTLQTLTFSQVPYYPDYNLRIFQRTRLVSRVHILIITIHHPYYDNPQVIQMEPKIMYNHLHLASYSVCRIIRHKSQNMQGFNMYIQDNFQQTRCTYTLSILNYSSF